MAICPSCGEENPDRFRLCGFCGTPLHPEEAPREIRKTVTIVFSDLVGSTAIGERLDSESLRAVMSRYFDVMRDELERHGGTVEKFIGDAVMAVFGLPNLHEDDAERAVRAAAGMQAALEGLNAELDARFGVTLKNRTGVNTGEVVSGDPTAGQRLVTGDAVNVAARLEQAAGTNEVLIGPLTRELVAHVTELEAVEPLELKGKSEPMPAFRLLGVPVGRPCARAARRGSSAVTRSSRRSASELAAVAEIGERAAWWSSRRSPAPGSRASSPSSWSLCPRGRPITRGRCLSYGQGITFWPVAEALRELAGILDDDPHDAARAKLDALAGGDRAAAERTAAAVGLTDAAYPVDELFWGLRRVLAEPRRLRPPGRRVRGSALGRADDARPGRAPGRDAGSGARPLHDARRGLAERATAGPPRPAGRSSSSTGSRPRRPPSWPPRSRARRSPRQRCGRSSRPRAATRSSWSRCSRCSRTRPAATSPFRRRSARSSRPGSTGSATRSARSSARRRSSARSSPRRPSSSSCRTPAGPRVPDDLGGLERRRLLQPHAAVMTTGPAFAFQHILIRDAAYASLLKRERAALHERFVTWADEVNGDRRERVRGDPRLPPRAGPRLPVGAGTARRPRARDRPAGVRAAAGGGPAGVRARRHAGRREPAAARGGAPSGLSTRTGSTCWSTWARR